MSYEATYYPLLPPLSVADPGFSQRERPKGANLFFADNCMKNKKIWNPGGRPWHPLQDQPMTM